MYPPMARTSTLSRRRRKLTTTMNLFVVFFLVGVLVFEAMQLRLIRGMPPDASHSVDAPQILEQLSEGIYTKNDDKFYFLQGGVLRQVQKCDDCGGLLDLCSSNIPLIPWSIVKELPLGDKFDCSDPPPVILDLMSSFSFDKYGLVKDDSDVVYFVDGKKVVRVQSCLDCGPLYGNICDRLPWLPKMSSLALSRIGTWPSRGLGVAFADSAPNFQCHRDIPDMLKPVHANRWLVITTPHVQFLAKIISDILASHNWYAQITTELPPVYDAHDYYIVLAANAFDSSKLPPADKRILVQLEQGSSHWFVDEYFKTMQESFAVLEYNLGNFEILQNHDISKRLFYLPMGANSNLAPAPAVKKKWDLIFYGDLRSERRQRMLRILQDEFDVKVVTETFGDDMQILIQQARFVINIHYFIPPSLEVIRIYEAISLGVPVISEDAPDSWVYKESLKSSVRFFDLDSTSSMLEVVREAVSVSSSYTSSTKNASLSFVEEIKYSHENLIFYFNRFLIGMELLPVSSKALVTYNPLKIPNSIFLPIILSLPETYKRRMQFIRETKIPVGPFFAGARLLTHATWMACAMSYSTIATLALNSGVKRITIAEDDVVFPTDYFYQMGIVEKYLGSLNGKWDLFSGLIADVHPKAKIISAETFDGMTFLTIDRMTSMVFNIYNTRMLEVLTDWDPSNEDMGLNTIDRYIENKQNLKIVVTVPFLVGHREDAVSTIWNKKNTAYSDMISKSELKLLKMYRDYLAEEGAAKVLPSKE